MLDIKKGSIFPFPSDETITNFESFYRVKLPKEYIEFLKEYNGGTPINNVFLMDKQNYVVERFLCLLDNDVRCRMGDKAWNEIRVVIAQLDERLVDNEDMLGMSIIPIASLLSGDFICFDYRENTFSPNICIWFHEESSEFSPVVQKIAENFIEFESALHM